MFSGKVVRKVFGKHPFCEECVFFLNRYPKTYPTYNGKHRINLQQPKPLSDIKSAFKDWSIPGIIIMSEIIMHFITSDKS